jgi:hypothetical protein
MVDRHEPISAKEMATREFNALRGRLLTAIESLGLPSKQERQIALLIKTLSYQNQAVILEIIDRLDPNDESYFKYLDYRLAQIENVPA